MAEPKQKPKMGKPKLKSSDSALPKDAKRMLAKEYRDLADERANDTKQRPEQEAVEHVEDGMRSGRDHALEAAKRGAKGLKQRGSENDAGGQARSVKGTFEQTMGKMMSALRGTIEAKTLSDYEYRMEVLKTCFIAKKRMDAIDVPMIQDSINEIAENRNLCESTCGKLIMFIKRTFRFAMECKDLTFDPVSKPKCLKIPTVATEVEDVKPLSKSDLDALLRVLKGTPRMSPVVYCMLLAGLRVGEALALTWNKIDFDAGQYGTIYINKAVKKYKVKVNGGTKTEYRLGPPKTKSSIRTVPMTEQLREHLLSWKTDQDFYAADKTDLGLVFPKRNGSLQDYDSFNIGFNKYLAKFGLDYHIYHSRVFRHTFASYLVKKGIAVKTLQKLMGHAKAETTMQYYVNVDQDSMDHAVQQIDVALVDPEFSFVNYDDDTQRRRYSDSTSPKVVEFPKIPKSKKANKRQTS